MGRRQDDSKEETWRAELRDLQELHGPGTVNNMNQKGQVRYYLQFTHIS